MSEPPLQALADSHSGRLHLHCDFDGTLVPIVADPRHCPADPELLRLLQRLADHPAVDVAILSGRSLEDLAGRLPVQGLALAGNHGLEIAANGASWCHPGAVAHRPLLRMLAGKALRMLAGIPGAMVEDKILSLSLHSRRVPPAWGPLLQQRLMWLESELAAWPELQGTRGRQVFEIRPALGWTKASAARLLCGRSSDATGVPFFYAGDDASDEEVFRAFPESITVKIAAAPTCSAARFRLESPRHLRRWLQQLLMQLPPIP